MNENLTTPSAPKKHDDMNKTYDGISEDEIKSLPMIMAAIPGAVYRYRLTPDLTQRFLFISPGAMELFGYSAEQLQESFELAWNMILAEDKDRLWGSIQLSAKTLSHWTHEFRVRIRNGEVRWLRGTAIPEAPKNDGSIVWNGILTDISDRKKVEQNLEEKNSALREIISHIETEKQTIKNEVMANVDHLVMPILRKLQKKGTSIEEKYLKLLEQTLQDLTSSFGKRIEGKLGRLTPREIEICNMIKNGLAVKEVSRLLNTSPRTIETHRHSIRKKLDLANKKINLTTYLRTL